MQLVTDRLLIRSWQPDDAEPMARLANNHAIWRNLRDRFPHPYYLEDATAYIESLRDAKVETSFAITLGGTPIGSIGIIPGEDIYRRTAEIGYWLGEPYWGKGYAPEALNAFTLWAFEAFDLLRCQAMVFTTNAASARVLEKCGYALESTARSVAVKDGVVCDEWVYVRLRSDRE